MDTALMLKAVADETPLKILTLLLKHNYCVSSLARSLELSEATISQHLEVLREAGLLSSAKRGYFMHYCMERDVLRGLASDIEALAATEREGCRHGQNGNEPGDRVRCQCKKARFWNGLRQLVFEGGGRIVLLAAFSVCITKYLL